jgi:hypothetical protein
MPDPLATPPPHRRSRAATGTAPDRVVDVTDRALAAVPAVAAGERVIDLTDDALATPAATPRWTRVALVVAAVATLVDAAATHAWLLAGHGEANPLLVALIARIGGGPAMAVRAVVGLGLLAALAPFVGRVDVARRGLALVTAALVGVCAYHLYGVVAHVV